MRYPFLFLYDEGIEAFEEFSSEKGCKNAHSSVLWEGDEQTAYKHSLYIEFSKVKSADEHKIDKSNSIHDYESRKAACKHTTYGRGTFTDNQSGDQRL